MPRPNRALPGNYLYTRNGRFYFHRRVCGQQVRVSLRTSNSELAKQFTLELYLFTSGLKRLGVSPTDLRRLTLNKVEALHEKVIRALISTSSGQANSEPSCIPEDLPPKNHRDSAPLSAHVTNPLLVSASLTEALSDVQRTGGGSEENLRKYNEAWTEFSEFNQGVSFHSVRHKDAKAHLNRLLQLPTRRLVKAKYKKKAIADVIELDIPPDELLSHTSINDRMKRLARLWQWATENEAYEGPNPFVSRSLRLEEKPRERGRYSIEDIKLLLSSPLYANQKFQKSPKATKSWWWLILLALYTGARCGELSQLTVNDIKQVEGVWCLSINDEEDKKVKTAAGIRLCPIHPELLQAGFLDYLDYLSDQGITHVLPYPNLNAKDPAQRCSKWYCGTYRPNHLPESWIADYKVFHSFRHTFINQAIKVLNLPLNKVQAIVGHEPSDMGETKRYARGSYKVSDLYSVMEAFSYEAVGLENLRGGWIGLSDL